VSVGHLPLHLRITILISIVYARTQRPVNHYQAVGGSTGAEAEVALNISIFPPILQRGYR